MITDAVLHFFQGLVNTLLAGLPNPSPPDIAGAVSQLGPVFQWIGWANNYLPVSEASVLIGVLLASFGVLYAFRFAVWIATKAHILGGSV